MPWLQKPTGKAENPLGIQMKDAAAPAPAAETGGTVLKPLPELHRTLLDDKAKRQARAGRNRGIFPIEIIGNSC